MRAGRRRAGSPDPWTACGAGRRADGPVGSRVAAAGLRACAGAAPVTLDPPPGVVLAGRPAPTGPGCATRSRAVETQGVVCPRPRRSLPPHARCAPGSAARWPATWPPPRRTSWPSRRPGAGKTTFALRVARRAAGRPGDRRDHRRHPDRAPQAPVVAGRGGAGRHRDRPGLPQLHRRHVVGLHRHRRHLRRRGRAPAAAPRAHREPAHPGRPRRGAPRRRRPVLGRRGQGGVRRPRPGGSP